MTVKNTWNNNRINKVEETNWKSEKSFNSIDSIVYPFRVSLLFLKKKSHKFEI